MLRHTLQVSVNGVDTAKDIPHSLVSAQVYFLYIKWVPFIDPWEPDMTSNAVKTMSATR
jgi:hypothetical protein